MSYHEVYVPLLSRLSIDIEENPGAQPIGWHSWNVLQLVEDLMEPKPIVELHTF